MITGWAAIASDDPTARARLGSVGRPLPSIELEIRDAYGKAVSAGERGEIYVRGEQAAAEYLGRNGSLTEDGWFPTNDGGRLDDDGYLYVEGRLDDVIVRGAEDISPGEIEEVLLDHPPSPKRPSSASPTTNGEKRSPLQSSSIPVLQPPPTNSPAGYATASAQPAHRLASNSGASSPTTRPASSSAASFRPNCPHAKRLMFRPLLNRRTGATWRL